ncbi:uncharacterized protein NECHADRAFT_89261 [Fusarium vanettenii 77-13-4]|uniref:Uncharacterized protein n=1 Tax=Fusarium vanettenii (strain ATCC MYA-4622 / CBS 123669 / FGSC 9596 / NRRL 45880 / 77-13-4) TaxID=660122 RepID=C7ZQN5_FUSV7|nr:uncharacterized protein NECHADRAFT_89261 [Fusarium vanettenii 77-13-4]EEU33665.1 hypothetical protein NECHADRAFT_89261 [Fusarium vanettenii 77-13-4]
MDIQGGEDPAPIWADEIPPGPPQIETAILIAIDDALTRLNRLGVTIRQSSRPQIDARATKFAAGHDLKSFSYMCANAVQSLYPGAHQSLKDYLSKSMTDRYARMLFFNARHKKLETRRETRIGLSPLPEIPSNETQAMLSITQPARTLKAKVLTNLAKASAAPSLSDLFSVNIQQIRSRLRAPDEASIKSRKTSSIQVNQRKYPPPPVANGDSNIFACEWCSEPLSMKTLSESNWRNPEALHLHLSESHNSDFPTVQLPAISRQSETEQPRAWKDCLLCCFPLEEQGNDGEAVRSQRPRILVSPA